MWDHYEKNLLAHFPYIGGDAVSGTKNLIGEYSFVSMGEVLQEGIARGLRQFEDGDCLIREESRTCPERGSQRCTQCSEFPLKT